MWIWAADSRPKGFDSYSRVRTESSAGIWVRHEGRDKMAKGWLGAGGWGSRRGAELGFHVISAERWQKMSLCGRDFAQFQKAQLKAGAPRFTSRCGVP